MIGYVQDRVQHLQDGRFDAASLDGKDWSDALIMSFCNPHAGM